MSFEVTSRIAGEPSHLYLDLKTPTGAQINGEEKIRLLGGCSAHFGLLFGSAMKLRIETGRTLYLEKKSVQDYLVQKITKQTPSKRNSRACRAAQRAIRHVAKQMKGDYHQNLWTVLSNFTKNSAQTNQLETAPETRDAWVEILQASNEASSTKNGPGVIRASTLPLARLAPPTVDDQLKHFFLQTCKYDESTSTKYHNALKPFTLENKRQFFLQLKMLHSARTWVNQRQEEENTSRLSLESQVEELKNQLGEVEKELAEKKTSLKEEFELQKSNDTLYIAAKKKESATEALIQGKKNRIEELEQKIRGLQKETELHEQRKKNKYYRHFIEQGAAIALNKKRFIEIGALEALIANNVKEKIDLNLKLIEAQSNTQEASAPYDKAFKDKLEQNDDVQRLEAQIVSKRAELNPLEEKLLELRNKTHQNNLLAQEIKKHLGQKVLLNSSVQRLSGNNVQAWIESLNKVHQLNELFLERAPEKPSDFSLKHLASEVYRQSTMGAELTTGAHALILEPIKFLGKNHQASSFEERYKEFLDTRSRASTPEAEIAE